VQAVLQKSGQVEMAEKKSLAVKKVRNGRGIVALKAFRRGAIVMEVVGKIVTDDEVWGYWEIDERLGANCYRYDDDHYLDPDGPIAAGDEVTHDYSTLLGGDDVWTMRCNCGESNCRRTVRNVGKLPAARVREYRKLGIIPDFIYATRNLKV
jgi:hypothetical protein